MLAFACSLQAALACTTSAPAPEVSADGEAAGGSTGQVSVLGWKGIHRLNSSEYNATVQDVLGTRQQPADSSWRGGELEGFDNMAAVLGIDETQFSRYYKAAQALASEVMSSEELRARFVSCQLAEPDCASSSIAAAGLHLFRRPLEPDELATYQRVYASALTLGDDESAAFTLALEALLSSAEFLYRIELDPEPDSSQLHPLGPFELASRLSYFLWSSAPDDALLQAAADGSLLQADVLAATVERMLADDKAQRLVSNFAGQWLGARQVPSHPADPHFYQWTPRVAAAASQEMLLYFGDFLQSGRSWLEFPSADFNYLNGELPELYGIPQPEGLTGYSVFERVEYTDDQRAGFLGLAGFLALSSLDRRTSPSRRGHWIAGNLLCAEPPPPPPSVPRLEPGADGMGGGASAINVRQVLEQHRTQPACAQCHSLFDPYGLALEQYDAIGRFRTSYDDGSPIDASVTLPPNEAHPEDVTVTGLAGIAAEVAADPRFPRCLARKLLTYGLGRKLTDDDEPYLERADDEWLRAGQTPSLRRLIQALVASDAFRSRRGGGPL